MRRRVAWAFVVGITPISCVGLLGSFDVEREPGPDAGPIASDAVADALVPDARSDADPSETGDGGADAAPRPCGLNDPFESAPKLLTALDGLDEDRGGFVTPDGQWLLFHRRATTAVETEIYAARWHATSATWQDARPLTALNTRFSPVFVPGPTPRIVFSSNRSGNFDIYYVNALDDSFTSFGSPTGIPAVNTGGLEETPYVVPMADGRGRMFYSQFVPVNHADLFAVDYNPSFVFGSPSPLSNVNLGDPSHETTPAWGNGALYFASNRNATGGAGASFNVWAAPQDGTGFGRALIVPALNAVSGNTELGSVSADGCTIILSSNRMGAGSNGYHLYVARRRRPL